MSSYTLEWKEADGAIVATVDNQDPTFTYRQPAEPGRGPIDFHVSFQRLWSTLRAGFARNLFEVADVTRWVEADPSGLILEALRGGLVNEVAGELFQSPTRRRRILSNAAHHIPLRGFQPCDLMDDAADLLLVCGLNTYTRTADVATLAVLADALLETDTDLPAAVA
jgi:hypothetical protein